MSLLFMRVAEPENMISIRASHCVLHTTVYGQFLRPMNSPKLLAQPPLLALKNQYTH
jgi:hypothetical protein